MLKKSRLAIVIIILAVIASFFGVYKYKADINSARTINEQIVFKDKGIRVKCIGQGSPTVIFEPGLNESYTTFMLIQQEISKSARTFVYDRLTLWGTGEAKNERTSLKQATALHELLEQLKVKGPYIIVAHSIAGFNARLFAANYPEEVAGVIFIDCSHENQVWNKSAINAKGELNYDEIIASTGEVRKANKADALRNIPITVLTADYKGRQFEAMYEYWLNKQKSIAALSDKSKHIIVEDSGHIIQSEHPEAVIDAIKDMLEQAR